MWPIPLSPFSPFSSLYNSFFPTRRKEDEKNDKGLLLNVRSMLSPHFFKCEQRSCVSALKRRRRQKGRLKYRAPLSSTFLHTYAHIFPSEHKTQDTHTHSTYDEHTIMIILKRLPSLPPHACILAFSLSRSSLIGSLLPAALPQSKT